MITGPIHLSIYCLQMREYLLTLFTNIALSVSGSVHQESSSQPFFSRQCLLLIGWPRVSRFALRMTAAASRQRLMNHV